MLNVKPPRHTPTLRVAVVLARLKSPHSRYLAVDGPNPN